MTESNDRDPATMPIALLIEQAIREGCWFPHDPCNPDGVQIRVLRSASAEGHCLADILRERRREVNAFHAARRPKWPDRDDGLPPRLDPDEPDSAILLIKLEGILFEDRVSEFIEREVSYVEQRIASIVERSIAARRADAARGSATAKARPRTSAPPALEFRGGKMVQR